MRAGTLGVVALAAFAAGHIVSAAPADARPARAAIPHRPALHDTSRRLEIGQVVLPLANDGNYGFDRTTGTAGTFFPKGFDKTLLFSGGPWIAAKVNGEWRGAVADFASEFVPGVMAGGTFTDPLNPDYRTYKVQRPGGATDTARVVGPALYPGADTLRHHAWSEYLLGAAPYGAPVRMHRLPVGNDSVDVLGPDVAGDQMLWCVSNDADPSRHRLRSGSTAPLGVEIQQTFFGFLKGGPIDNVVFMRYRIANLGGHTLDSLWFGFWSDPDLGGAGDDHVGSDSTRDLVYTYNAHYRDMVYEEQPPAIGYVLLGGPTLPGGTRLGPYALTGPLKSQEPQNILETMRWLRGLESNGNPRLDPAGHPSRFWFSGDPVVGLGWLDTLRADRRMMLSTGPISMAPGDTQVVVAAIVIGDGSDNLSSVARLRCIVDAVRAFHQSGVPDAGPALGLSCPFEVAQSCPRSVSFWRTQCISGGPPILDLPRIAACVDQNSISFDGGADPLAEFCAVMTSTATDARSEARRQHAALLANLCAGRLGLAIAGADSVFLGDRIELWSAMVGARNVGQLAAPAATTPCLCADSVMVALASQPLTDPAVEAAYRDLAGELRAVNGGIGIGPTCAQRLGEEPTLIEATTTPLQVDLTWDAGAGAGVPAAIDREGARIWQGRPTAGRIHYVDRDVQSNTTYRYRISMIPGGREQFYALATVTTGPLPPQTGLTVHPTPAAGALAVRFHLWSNAPATIEVYDLRGRRISSQRVANPSVGTHQMSLSGALEAGIYVVRLRQGGQSASAKAVVLR